MTSLHDPAPVNAAWLEDCLTLLTLTLSSSWKGTPGPRQMLLDVCAHPNYHSFSDHCHLPRLQHLQYPNAHSSLCLLPSSTTCTLIHQVTTDLSCSLSLRSVLGVIRVTSQILPESTIRLIPSFLVCAICCLCPGRRNHPNALVMFPAANCFHLAPTVCHGMSCLLSRVFTYMLVAFTMRSIIFDV